MSFYARNINRIYNPTYRFKTKTHTFEITRNMELRCGIYNIYIYILVLKMILMHIINIYTWQIKMMMIARLHQNYNGNMYLHYIMHCLWNKTVSCFVNYRSKVTEMLRDIRQNLLIFLILLKLLWRNTTVHIFAVVAFSYLELKSQSDIGDFR